MNIEAAPDDAWKKREWNTVARWLALKLGKTEETLRAYLGCATNEVLLGIVIKMTEKQGGTAESVHTHMRAIFEADPNVIRAFAWNNGLKLAKCLSEDT